MNDDSRPVDVGDAAPDITLRDEDGGDAQLSEYWQQQPTTLVFVRHYG